MTTPTIASGTGPMTDRNESLIALAEWVEAATGPDRELDYTIEKAVGDARRFKLAYAYTASLDAAMTLVPDGWDWLVRNDVEERGSFANVSRPNKQHIIDTWDEERRCFYAGNTDGCNYAQAATPALALAAAALKARAAQ